MVKQMFVRSGFPFNYDTELASNESALRCVDESRTDQSGKEDADINTIVHRFGLTGVMPGAMVPPSYEDFTEVFDFQSAMNVITEARAKFMSMPASVRARFSNDPQIFLEFCGAEKDGVLVNLEEMRELGLAVPAKVEPPPPPPIRVEVINPSEGDPAARDR